MSYSDNILKELNILSRYDSSNTQEGIKVHSSADTGDIEATQRLHNKGLLSQEDGGYLTSLGQTAVEHSEALLRILEATPSSN